MSYWQEVSDSAESLVAAQGFGGRARCMLASTLLAATGSTAAFGPEATVLDTIDLERELPVQVTVIRGNMPAQAAWSPRALIEQIRTNLKLPISAIARLCGVTRQAVYKWIDDVRATAPMSEHMDRLQALKEVSDRFSEAGIENGKALLDFKMFEGRRSLADLIQAGEYQPEFVDDLVEQDRDMEAAYHRSGLAKSKAEPDESWRAAYSLPGGNEST